MVVRVAIADDQELVRAGLRGIIEAEPDLEVIGEASDGQRAVELALREQPDVFLMDVRMPGLDGIQATEQIVAAQGTTRVLVLTTFDLDENVYRAVKAGAAGFLLKDLPAEDLVAAIRHAARGSDALLAPAVTRRLVERFAQRRPPTKASVRVADELTARELEVLRLVASGLSNSEISEELHVSGATVKTHVARVLMKLGLRDRVQAVVVAYESGLVTPGAQE
ncbi:MAG TPA: response regulator transcription factor [Candidatus Dormibacteraeota bacterium]|nr:response regulator transcription factor [Candidatus Dormibacteraeota bacterium]